MIRKLWYTRSSYSDYFHPQSQQNLELVTVLRYACSKFVIDRVIIFHVKVKSISILLAIITPIPYVSETNLYPGTQGIKIYWLSNPIWPARWWWSTLRYFVQQFISYIRFVAEQTGARLNMYTLQQRFLCQNWLTCINWYIFSGILSF